MKYEKKDFENWFTLKFMYATKHIPLLKHIYIETTNYCNFNCSFCPVGMGIRKEKKHIMSMKLFKNIVDMLSNSSLLKGVRISLYGNNEPLLDDTIIEKIEYIKLKLPDNYVYISSNGILFSEYLDRTVSSKIDCFYIQVYNENIYKKIVDELNSKNICFEEGKFTTSYISYKCKIYITKRFGEENDYVLMNRAGRAYKTKNIKNSCCICPFVDLHINSYGDIQMCTFDALGDTIFDNIFNYATLDDAWYSKKFKEIRKNMLQNGKFGFDVCSKCDIKDNSYRLNSYEI